jgi:hypothetical protein
VTTVEPAPGRAPGRAGSRLEGRPDSAPEIGLDGLEMAIEGRNAGAARVPAGERRGRARRSAARGGSGPNELAAPGNGAEALDVADEGALTLPSLDFRFSAPSFLGNRSRWLLFLTLVVVAALAIVAAWDMVRTTYTSEGAEWIGPPIFTLVLAGFSLAFAFATVMGFGNVDLRTAIGHGEGGDSKTDGGGKPKTGG